MADPAVTIRGLPEFRRALRGINKEWPKELRKVHKKIATDAQKWAQAEAAGMGGIQSAAAKAIKAKATQSRAAVGVSGGKRVPYGAVAFWGVKKRLGWFARRRYSGESQHLPKWVGNTWDAAVHGQGPYAINDALADHMGDLLDDYGRMLDELTFRAFPDRF